MTNPVQNSAFRGRLVQIKADYLALRLEPIAWQCVPAFRCRGAAYASRLILGRNMGFYPGRFGSRA